MEVQALNQPSKLERHHLNSTEDVCDALQDRVIGVIGAGMGPALREALGDRAARSG